MRQPSALADNLGILSAEEKKISEMLVSLGQEHLFAKWPPPGTDDRRKRGLLHQAAEFDKRCAGGLAAYVENARKLLRDCREGVNPFAGAVPRVPAGVSLKTGSEEFLEAERLGLDCAADAVFALVAGGLGERLGFKGIKVALPCETATDMSFLEFYIRHILAFQRRAEEKRKKPVRLPLFIMTSEDTHGQTAAFLEKNGCFGLEKSQVTLMRQEKVPSLLDTEARFGLSESDPYTIDGKPHGHGDIHGLIYSSGLAARWAGEGRKWLVFFQDTNALAFKAIPAALGISAREKMAINSVAVPRRAKEAAGGIATLAYPDGREITINVEYNQLDPLLRATVNPEGDVADKSGFSPYPCNINVLVFALEPYLAALKKSGGAVPEFVNPKFADPARTVFKKPARLECMMQDFPKLLGPEAKVGYTIFERWLSFSAVKNSLDEARAKAKAGLPIESASTGEADLFAAGRRLLELAGMKVEAGKKEDFAGLTVETAPMVALDPDFAPTLDELKKKVRGGRISGRSALVVQGRDVELGGLDLDGALVVRAAPKAAIRIKKLTVHNAGWELAALFAGEEAPQELLIRGYRIAKKEQRVIESGSKGFLEIVEG